MRGASLCAIIQLLTYLYEVKSMAACAVCGKTTKFGNQVSFAGNRNNRTFKPNLQTVRAVINGRIMKVTVCTRCLKAGKIQKAI